MRTRRQNSQPMMERAKVVFQKCEFIPKDLLAQILGVSRSTIYRYLALLQKNAPSEFKWEKGVFQLSCFQAHAVAKVRALFLEGFSKQQIEEQLRKRGIWNECRAIG